MSSSNRIGAFVLVVLAEAVPLQAGDQPCELGWDTAIGQLQLVNAIGVYDLGTGPVLYAGGYFGPDRGSVAAWNGSSWVTLGTGMEAPAGSGIYPQVFALALFDDGDGPAIYAGGQFEKAGGVVVENIAKWDGSSWSALEGGTSDTVITLTAFDDGSGSALYVGGTFIQADDYVVNHIAKWNGTAWFPVGNGLDQTVNALAVFEDARGRALYAGGNFVRATDGTLLGHIARWANARWERLGAGVDNHVLALVANNGSSAGGPALYLGGKFIVASGVSASYVAKWDGASMSAMGRGTNGFVRALSVFDDGSGPALYAGGSFTAESGTGGASLNHIGKWGGHSWSGLGGGTNGTVKALAHAGTTSPNGSWLNVGGEFTTVGGESAYGSARWGSACAVGDCDSDGDVDSSDYSRLHTCLRGPVGGLRSGCSCVDADANGHVDLFDAASFQRAFTADR